MDIVLIIIGVLLLLAGIITPLSILIFGGVGIVVMMVGIIMLIKKRSNK